MQLAVGPSSPPRLLRRSGGQGASRSILSSWTTYQMRSAQIDKLMVLAKTTQPVRIDVGGSPERRVIEAVH